MGTRSTRWVQGYEVGTRRVRGVQGGYDRYEVGMRGTRWVQGVRGGYEVGMRGMR